LAGALDKAAGALAALCTDGKRLAAAAKAPTVPAPTNTVRRDSLLGGWFMRCLLDRFHIGTGLHTLLI
jgi:hypothetical protein